MSKKEKSYVTGSVTIKGTFSQLRDPVDKKVVRSRGPGQLGQSKPSATVRLGRIGTDELARRLALATRVLETGKGPAKGEDANLAKLKEVQAELKESTKELELLLEKHELTLGAFQEQTKTLEDLKAKEVPDETRTPDPDPIPEEAKDSEEVKSDDKEGSGSLEEKLKEAADPAVESPEPKEEPEGNDPA
jgi:dsDNA-specific endonuclease/ATPase MutS2